MKKAEKMAGFPGGLMLGLFKLTSLRSVESSGELVDVQQLLLVLGVGG